MKPYFFFAVLCGLTACTLISQSPTPTPLPKPGSGAPVIGGTPAQLPTPESTPLPAAVPVEGLDIQQLMLTSHTRWQSFWADGLIIYYAAGGSNTPVQTIRVQIWISQAGKSRVLVGDAGGTPMEQTASDGAYYKGLDGIIQPIADFILQPFSPPSSPSDTIFPHPMTNLLSTPLGDLVFPTALAQRGGNYTVVGHEVYIGREALQVEWRREAGGVLIDRFLVDSQTGVLLRQQNYGKPGGEALNSDLYFTAVLFESEYSEATFYLGLPLPSHFARNYLDLSTEQP